MKRLLSALLCTISIGHAAAQFEIISPIPGFVTNDTTYNAALDSAWCSVTPSASYSYVPDARFAEECKKAEAIDLGLPSGTLWASCNLGSGGTDTIAGDVFSFAVVEPNQTGTQACNNLMRPIDNVNRKLLPESDAATVNWGSPWSTPSCDDWQELIDYCEIVQVSSVLVEGTDYFTYRRGLLVTGPSGNSIFLPYQSVSSGNNEVRFYNANYYSANLFSDPMMACGSAWICFMTDVDDHPRVGSWMAWNGSFVRPVRKPTK